MIHGCARLQAWAPCGCAATCGMLCVPNAAHSQRGAFTALFPMGCIPNAVHSQRRAFVPNAVCSQCCAFPARIPPWIVWSCRMPCCALLPQLWAAGPSLGLSQHCCPQAPLCTGCPSAQCCAAVLEEWDSDGFPMLRAGSMALWLSEEQPGQLLPAEPSSSGCRKSTAVRAVSAWPQQALHPCSDGVC